MNESIPSPINRLPANHSKSSHVYENTCNDCKISYESGIENGLCPQCKKKPIKSELVAIRDYAPRSLWEKIARKIRKYLP